jgi:hypothetical protein
MTDAAMHRGSKCAKRARQIHVASLQHGCLADARRACGVQGRNYKRRTPSQIGHLDSGGMKGATHNAG